MPLDAIGELGTLGGYIVRGWFYILSGKRRAEINSLWAKKGIPYAVADGLLLLAVMVLEIWLLATAGLYCVA